MSNQEVPVAPARPTGSPGLTRDRVVKAGLALADDRGLSGVTMRALGESLGVEAMSLYHHVANKEALLDAMVDHVFTEVAVPTEAPWREAIETRCRSLRDVLTRHPWALPLLESRRNPGPATLDHHDRVLGVLRAGGFDVAAAAHAVSFVDAYVFGFVLQEQSLPITEPQELDAMAAELMAAEMAAAYPNLAELVAGHSAQPGYSYAAEFETGLPLVLDGLETLRRTSSGTRRASRR
jgi:AcrR family transcriptional regulator